MRAPKEIFREYDVRGLVDEQLTPTLAEHLGKAIGTRIVRAGGTSAVVGRDHRASGESLAGALVAGLASTGLRVVDIGVVPTPVQYWAIAHLQASGGVQVTGSHNPPEYNGFKITLASGPLFGDDVRALHAAIEQEDYAHGQGSREQQGVLQAYLDDLAGSLEHSARGLTVVVDAGNGTGGITAVPLYQRLGHRVIPLFCEPDGTFPNHHPDPTVESNLDDLKRAVREHKADLGLAFDGDADRLGVVDAQGTVIWGDRLMILYSRDVLAAEPGATILGEVKCSKVMYDAIREAGGRAIMWKAGHSLLKAKMKEEHAALAGEMSGHIFFKHRYYGFDDGVYAGARLLEILDRAERPLHDLLADVPSLPSTPELRMDCPDAHKFELVRRATKRFAVEAATNGSRVVDVDGARVEWADGWGLVRCSNTQPILVLRYEAVSNERLQAIRSYMETTLAEVRAELGL